MTGTDSKKTDGLGALRLPEFRYWLGAAGFASLGSRALAVAITYQIYAVTQNPLALGLLGLIEAIPAVGLALFGGHVADRYNRRSIVLWTRLVTVVSAIGFALISINVTAQSVWLLYGVVFIAGVARGFADPATSAFEAQVVPRELYVSASTWGGSVWQVTAVVGPAMGGLIYGAWGGPVTYLIIAGLFGLAWICTTLITDKPLPPVTAHESIWESMAIGVRYVFGQQILVGSMALDLFAVLFGGAVALLPVFATDILKVGATGQGLLAAAPSAGALVSMLWATRRPPTRNAGKILLGVVAGFGVSIIVFALSRNFVLSLVALALSGMFDGVSVVIRDTSMRLLSPEKLRGRIAAVNWIFIGSSNEIGAFESGVVASLVGAVPAVWLGGIVTLVVVAVTAVAAPKLRALNLAPEEHMVDDIPGELAETPPIG